MRGKGCDHASISFIIDISNPSNVSNIMNRNWRITVISYWLNVSVVKKSELA